MLYFAIKRGEIVSKERFTNVRQLITDKRYGEARFILEDIGNTQAQEWLWRLDKIEGKHHRNRRLKLIGGLVVLIIVAGAGVFILQQSTARITRDMSMCFDNLIGERLDACLDAGGWSKYLAGS